MLEGEIFITSTIAKNAGIGGGCLKDLLNPE
jgi:hypothetical protein